jgi:hypothetical protein
VPVRRAGPERDVCETLMTHHPERLFIRWEVKRARGYSSHDRQLLCSSSPHKIFIEALGRLYVGVQPVLELAARPPQHQVPKYVPQKLLHTHTGLTQGSEGEANAHNALWASKSRVFHVPLLDAKW